MTLSREAIERLAELADELRRAGYLVGVDQCIAAQHLLLALATRGVLPDDSRGLATLLGPVFCKSPMQQEDFRARFERWAGALGARPDAAPSRAGLHEELGEVERGSRVWTLVLPAVSVVAVLAALFMTLIRPTRSPAGKASAVVRMHAVRTRSPITKEDLPSTVAEAHTNLPGATKRPTGGEPPNAEAVAGVDVSVATSPSPAPPVPALSEATGRRGRIATALLLVTTLPLAALAAWHFWWASRARLFLSRGAATAPPELGRVGVRGVRGRLYRGEGLSRTTRDLCRRRPVASQDLDVAATVGATVRHAGWFTPRPGRRRVVPEYLVLVEREGYRDHQARLVNELLDRLANDGLHVNRYFFDGDPRVCHTGWSGVGTISARELAGRYSNYRLLVVSDGTALISPLTGEPVAWSDQFGRWLDRVLLTPEPIDRWGDREFTLASLGWVVLPATEEGLSVLAEVFNREPPAPLPSARPSPLLPDSLLAHPTRWLGRREPGPDELNALLDGLRRYLGEADFEWLAACAIYPELHWDLTLYLGTRLDESSGQPPDPVRIAALARLPWFRHGAMPDWLRTRLVGAMSASREREVRFALQSLFLTALERPAHGFDLEIAHDRRGPVGLLAARVFRILHDRAPDHSPLRDPVFAAVMTGRRPPRLGLSLPHDLLALLRDIPAHIAPRRPTLHRFPGLLLRFAVPALTRSLPRKAILRLFLSLTLVSGIVSSALVLVFHGHWLTGTVTVDPPPPPPVTPPLPPSIPSWVSDYLKSRDFQAADRAVVDGSGWPEEIRRISNDGSGSMVLRGKLYLPKGVEYTPKTDEGTNDAGLPNVLERERDKTRFHLIEGDEFILGAWDKSNPAFTEDEKPGRLARLSTYYMQETEVTNKEIQAFSNDVGLEHTDLRIFRAAKTELLKSREVADWENHPAIGISRKVAEKYAHHVGGELPSERQWEFAARSRGKKQLYVWPGDQVTDSNGDFKAHIESQAVDKRFDTRSVWLETFFATDCTKQGIHGLAGNVREWCRDVWRPYGGNSPPDYVEPPRDGELNKYLIRGGSFKSPRETAHVTWRGDTPGQAGLPYRADADESFDDVGFRVVLEVIVKRSPPESASASRLPSEVSP